jgi:hypothetical protein
MDTRSGRYRDIADSRSRFVITLRANRIPILGAGAAVDWPSLTLDEREVASKEIPQPPATGAGGRVGSGSSL